MAKINKIHSYNPKVTYNSSVIAIINGLSVEVESHSYEKKDKKDYSKKIYVTRAKLNMNVSCKIKSSISLSYQLTFYDKSRNQVYTDEKFRSSFIFSKNGNTYSEAVIETKEEVDTYRFYSAYFQPIQAVPTGTRTWPF